MLYNCSLHFSLRLLIISIINYSKVIKTPKQPFFKNIKWGQIWAGTVFYIDGLKNHALESNFMLWLWCEQSIMANTSLTAVVLLLEHFQKTSPEDQTWENPSYWQAKHRQRNKKELLEYNRPSVLYLTGVTMTLAVSVHAFCFFKSATSLQLCAEQISHSTCWQWAELLGKMWLVLDSQI